MPNATGFITNREVKEIRDLVGKGMSKKQVASLIGCAASQVSRHSGNLSSIRNRAQRYDRLVETAANHVPAFGSGRTKSYALQRRAQDVLDGWPYENAPAASLIYSVLKSRGGYLNTADIADKLHISQAIVARICEIDQDIRHFASCRTVATF